MSFKYTAKEITQIIDSFSPDSIQDLHAKETITNYAVMILKVKRLDCLGGAMCDFRHGWRHFQAQILDTAWLRSFKERKVEVRPGDALRANVKIDVNYGYDLEVVTENRSIMEVLAVIPADVGVSGEIGLKVDD